METVKRMRRYFILAAAFFSAVTAFSQQDSGLLERIDRKMNPESYESYRSLVDTYPDGKIKEFAVFMVKKGLDKVALLFLSPASEKGKTTLRTGDNMWLYIPKVGKPVRITSLQSVTGGIFNNSDIMQIDYSAEYDIVKSDPAGDGLVLDLKAKNRTVAYDALKMWISAEEMIQKIECYSASGMLIKTLEFKEVRDFGDGLKRPSVMETYSPLYKGYRSSITFTSIRPRILKDEVFTINNMSRMEALRK